jgi:hypothetical protein
MLAAARGVEFDARRLSRKFCCNECDLLGCLGGSRCATVLSSQFSVCPDHEIQAGGMHAQEWLGAVKLPERKDRKYGFALETTRRTPSRMSPKIHVGFDSGEPGIDGVEHETSVSDKEAVTLWDRAVESIRPRKGAP